jgi:hypothetical protein
MSAGRRNAKGRRFANRGTYSKPLGVNAIVLVNLRLPVPMVRLRHLLRTRKQTKDEARYPGWSPSDLECLRFSTMAMQ